MRLDAALVARGLVETRERAHSLVLAGAVSVGGRPATKPSMAVGPEAELAVVVETLPYVSRGGLKLVAALDRWQLDVTGCAAIDVGASTGGFTDVLLQRGARRVYAVDVGYGQLHYRLRQDPRVVVMERTNARHLAELPERPDLAVADVSFISLRLVLPPVLALITTDAWAVTLVKPQFEAGRGQVGKGGVVRDPATRRQVLRDLVRWSAQQGLQIADVMPSPIQGPAGNVEFLALWRREAPVADDAAIERALAESASARARGGG